MRKLFFSCLFLTSVFISQVNGQGYNITPTPYNPQPNTGISLLGAFSGVDDGVSGAISMGFDFCFYGNVYNEVYVGTNGWVSFSPNQPSTFTAVPIPSTAGNVPRNCVMAPWQDWWSTIGGNGDIRYQLVGTAPFRKFVVSFVSVPMFSCTQNLGTFQVVLNECSNTIEVYIQNKPNCAWAGGTGVLGLHDGTGTIAHTVTARNSTVWTVLPTSPEGWLFRPDGFCEGGAFGGFASVDTVSRWPVVEADCYGSTITLKAQSGDLTCVSIDPGGSDFRLYTPKGTLMQVRNVAYTCVDGRTDSLTLTLAQQFLFNGDHYLVIRNGIDGNGLDGECGTGAFAFDTIIVRLSDCYEYNDPIHVRNVSVNKDNESVTVGWSSPANFDPNFFETYKLYVNDSLGSWREFVQVNDINDTSIITSEVNPQLESRDFKAVLMLKFYGDVRTPGDTVNNILLRASDDRLENGIRGDAQIEWVEYKAWQEDFEIYLAPANAEEGELIGTSSTSSFTFQKPEEVGNYKVWVKTARADLVYTANSNQLFFEIEQRDIKVPNVITPNGDGANDFFFVEGLEYYPQNTVQLFNRWGQVVFTANNYTNNYSPTDLEAGTYYYKVIVPDEPEQNGPIRIVK